MPVPRHEIEDKLFEAFPRSEIKVVDTMGDQNHYGVTIVSDRFEGSPKVKRHQMVHRALGEMVGTSLHALTLKLMTPQEKEQ